MPIFWRMVFLFAFILIGFILAKTKKLPENSPSVLSKLENYVFVPALVMSTFLERGSVETLSSAWKYLVGGAVLTLALIPLSLWIVRVCFKEYSLRNWTAYGLIFSNFGFMGNAIVSAVFPEIFFEYTMFTLPMWFLIYLWGVPTLLIGDEKKTGVQDRIKSFINPMLIAMLIGLVIALTGLKLPEAVGSVIDVSAECMSPLAMILTGMIIATIQIKPLVKNWQLYAITFVRLLAFPLLYILVFAFIPQGSFLTQTMLVCGMCTMSMPMGLNAIVIPSAYGKDVSYSAGLVFVTSLLSMITIPLLFMLFSAVVI